MVTRRYKLQLRKCLCIMNCILICYYHLDYAFFLRYKNFKDHVPVIDEKFWGPAESSPDSKSVFKPFKVIVGPRIMAYLNYCLDEALASTNVTSSSDLSPTFIRKFIYYWRHQYDWTSRQEFLNNYRQLITTVQGFKVHFFRIKSLKLKKKKVITIPLLLIHDWPSSSIEFHRAIPYLIKPRPEWNFAFEIIIPSLPGTGFSGRTVPGLDTAQASAILKNLMTNLGFKRFFVHGSGWGSLVATNLAILFPDHVAGVHTTMCTVDNIALQKFQAMLRGYSIVDWDNYKRLNIPQPENIHDKLYESPVELALYLLNIYKKWNHEEYDIENNESITDFTLRQLDNIMIYWITGSLLFSKKIYSDHKNENALKLHNYAVRVPSYCLKFEEDLKLNKFILEYRYTKLVTEEITSNSGHFGVWETPEILLDSFLDFMKKRKEQKNSNKPFNELTKSIIALIGSLTSFHFIKTYLYYWYFFELSVDAWICGICLAKLVDSYNCIVV